MWDYSLGLSAALQIPYTRLLEVVGHYGSSTLTTRFTFRFVRHWLGRVDYFTVTKASTVLLGIHSAYKTEMETAP